ncbi:MAG: deoxynucleoside kinase [Deltaproteobacteria bacterium]|nr:deoxynucleoside kinase [Deltaproteobacteria bacterium]
MNIAIEGPIGVGKTELARMLSNTFDARLILEPQEDNPFLEKFYKQPQRYAFQTQIHFLFERYRLIEQFKQQDLFHKVTISDFIYEKDRIFAYINLTDPELILYEKIWNIVIGEPIKFDLVIYLEARIDVLINRIRKRNRPYERDISIGYLDKLIKAYNEFFYRWNNSPLLVVHTSEIDFVKNPEDYERLVENIRQMKGGRQDFIPSMR